MENVSVVLGSRAVIECAVDGDNPITVEWSRNGRAMTTAEEEGEMGDERRRKDDQERNRITVSA